MRRFIFTTLLIFELTIFNLSGALANTWAPPTAEPPGGNTEEPLDESGRAQTKAGDLTIGGILTVTDIQGPVDIIGVTTITAVSDIALTGETQGSSNNDIGVKGVAPSGGWAGYFEGVLGVSGSASVGATAGYFVVGGRSPAAGYLNNGDAYFYGDLGVVGDIAAGSLTLNSIPITSWSDVKMWTDAADYIYPSTAGAEISITDDAQIFINSLVSNNERLKVQGDDISGYLAQGNIFKYAVYGKAGVISSGVGDIYRTYGVYGEANTAELGSGDKKSYGVFGYGLGMNKFAAGFIGNVEIDRGNLNLDSGNQICLDDSCISSWSDAGPALLWTDNGSYISNIDGSFSVYDNGQITAGSASLVLGATENLLYGNIDYASTGNLLLLQNESSDKFKVDKDGKTTIANDLIVNGGVVIGASTTCNSSNAGKLRYYTDCVDVNNKQSQFELCSQIGTSSYSWNTIWQSAEYPDSSCGTWLP